jgi:hypothetical protein
MKASRYSSDRLPAVRETPVSFSKRMARKRPRNAVFPGLS